MERKRIKKKNQVSKAKNKNPDKQIRRRRKKNTQNKNLFKFNWLGICFHPVLLPPH